MPPPRIPQEVGRIEQLSPRQREVAVLLAWGKTNREIADKIGASVKTVDSHRAAILRRLGLRNNVELCLLAIRQGEIDNPMHLSAYHDLFARHDAVVVPDVEDAPAL